MRVSSLPIDHPQWAEFVATNAAANPFHLPAWATVIADCYRFNTFVLAVRDHDGEILAGAPTVAVRSALGRLRWVSLPFSDVCPLLVRPGTARDSAICMLKEHVLASRVHELELRADLPAARDCHPVVVGYNYSLELPSDPAALHPNKGHRYSRNRAFRKGVQVIHGDSAEDMATFYRLHTLTRRRLGVPVQPRRFFDLIWDRLIARGHGFVASATLDDQVIAAGVYLAHNGTLVAKYYASDPSHMDTGAGYAIDWETMAFGCSEGYHTLDLGRSDLDADGLRLYKSSWGATERPLVYSHISLAPPHGTGPAVGEMPRRIIRRSPLWVCRALGEVLYRWSA